jgi:DmsE family decaheme c-type cytochrome
MGKNRLLPAVIAVLVVGFVGYSAAIDPPETKRGYAGSEVCQNCHEDSDKNLLVSAHADAKLPDGSAKSCEACHGPGSAHAGARGGNGNIFAFKDTDTAKAKTDACLACHAGPDGTCKLKNADHPEGNVTCSDCHPVHKAGGKDMVLVSKSTKICISCHQEMLSATALNEHHRIWEGTVTCWDCHEQHGKGTRTQLGGFKQEQMCFKCHMDKQGPFMFEHGAVRVEGCEICHDPHGSVNRHMLTYQKVADLCLSCHTFIPRSHTRYDANTQCTNCHTAIHGSNLNQFFMK